MTIGNPGNEWWSTLVATGCSEGFFERYGTREPRSRDAVHYLVRDPSNASTMYAGLGEGMAKTIDGGATWTAINQGLASQEATVAS